MKNLIIILILISLATPCLATDQEINGSYPICTSSDAINDFVQAKTFNDAEKMQKIIVDGECTFVGSEVACTIIENTMNPKVMVFVPFKSPIVGWTAPDNLK